MAKQRILVADDEPTIRDIFRIILEDDYDVDLVCDGEALYKLGGINYDLIITDVDMPGYDGDEGVELAKTFGNASPVLIITGDTRYHNEKYEVVYKPFDLKELKEKIKKLVKRV